MANRTVDKCTGENRVSQKTISNFENPKEETNEESNEKAKEKTRKRSREGSPSMDKVIHLAKVLDVSLDYIAGKSNASVKPAVFDRFFREYCDLNELNRMRVMNFINFSTDKGDNNGV